MHAPLNCQQVNSLDANERNRMETFAKSFDHNISSWRFPIFEMKRDEKSFGYAQIVHIPIVFTAWNPKACKPRDFIDGLNWWRAWGLTQNNHGFTTVALENKTFTPDLMKKIGFKRMNLELYET
jgi:hypothetical protein